MHIELTNFRSMHPDFKTPTRRNGEELQPLSIAVQGQYLVCRFVGWEPIEGAAFDEFFLDCFFGPDGREVFLAFGKIVVPPPEPPTFFERLSDALRLVSGTPPQYT
jgi:hypothetical protein